MKWNDFHLNQHLGELQWWSKWFWSCWEMAFMQRYSVGGEIFTDEKSPEDESYWVCRSHNLFSSTTSRFTFLVESEMSQYLDGFPWTDISGAQRMNLNYCGYLLTFHLSTTSRLNLSHIEWNTSTSTWWIGTKFCRHSWFPQDESEWLRWSPDFSSNTTTRFTVVLSVKFLNSDIKVAPRSHPSLAESHCRCFQSCVNFKHDS